MEAVTRGDIVLIWGYIWSLQSSTFADKTALLSGKVFELGAGTHHKHRSRIKLLWQRFWTLPYLSMQYCACSWVDRDLLSSGAFDLSRSCGDYTDNKPLHPMASFSIACIHIGGSSRDDTSHSKHSTSRLPARASALFAVDR